MIKLNLGDRVRVLASWNSRIIGKEATVSSLSQGFPEIRFDFIDKDALHNGIDHTDGDRYWFVISEAEAEVELVKKSDTITLGVPVDAMNRVASLKPQAQKIISHLKKGKTISPLEAMTVYSVARLAASIREIRLAGYNVVTTMRRDEAGHGYARYSLAA